MAAGDIARWTGAAADGDWDTSGNWTAESGTPSTPPASDEIAMFDHRSGSNSNVTAGLDQSAVDLQGMVVKRGFSGTIGGAGGALIISISNVTTISKPKLEWSSNAGSIYIGGGSEVIDEIQCNGSGRIVVAGGTATVTVAERGSNVTINNGTAVATIQGKGGTVVDLGGSAGTTIVASGGGRVTSKRSWTTVTNSRSETILSDGALTITTLNIYGGGQHTHNSTGTITTLNGVEGKLVAQDYDFTVTTSNEYTGLFDYVSTQGGGKITIGTLVPIGDTTVTL